MQRIGVFVCWCGSNIAGTVDVHKVAETLKNEAGVVFSTDYQYMCSQAGQDLVKNTIKEYNLTGVVICSCSPRMHENTFRKAAASVGLNPYMVEIANIREQCSWIHKDMATATEKAIILGRAAIAKVHLNARLRQAKAQLQKEPLLSAAVLPVSKLHLILPRQDLRLILLKNHLQSAAKWLKLIKHSRLLTVRLVF